MDMRPLIFLGLATLLPLSAQISFQIFSADFRPSSVTSAPYSATQTTERTRTLADGTHLNTPEDAEMMICRDSAGRTRIELHSRTRTAPVLVTIVDPVEGFRYELNSNSKVAQRFTLPAPRPVAAGEPPPVAIPEEVVGVVYTRPIMDGAVQGIGAAGNHFQTTSELLGTQTIEGVTAEGSRVTTTLEAGAVGNDREIVVTDERWYSKQLQVLVLTKLSDPRFGTTSRKLAAISLTEPDPGLFIPPTDYAIKNMADSTAP